jgi:hypothetical protein
MTMLQRRRARTAPRRVVLSVVMIAAFSVIGCTSSLHDSPSAAVPEPGPAAAPHPSLPVGELAPDFVLCDLDGGHVRLSDYRRRMPVVLEFGSITCPIVTGRAAKLDTLARDLEGQVQFLFVYSREEHPGEGERRTTSYGTFRALPQVRDYPDRFERAHLFRSTVTMSRQILVDADGTDSVADRYGIRGHDFVIVDAQGRVASVGPGPGHMPDLATVLDSSSSTADRAATGQRHGLAH